MLLFAGEVRSPKCIGRFSVLLVLVTILFAGKPSLLAQDRIASSIGPVAAPNPPGSANSSSPLLAAVSLSPEQLGDLHMAHRSYQEAIEAYRQAPLDSAIVWNKIGIANQQMFNFVEAQKSYENSLKLDPRNSEVINNLGTIYYSLKEYRTAEKLYRKAIKYSPKSALVYKNLGTAYLAQKKMKRGWECFQTALKIDPQAFEGSGHYHIGDPTPSQQLGAMNYYLAKSYILAGMKERAIDYLRMALDEGFTDLRKVRTDKEFASLYDFPAFQQLLASGKSQ